MTTPGQHIPNPYCRCSMCRVEEEKPEVPLIVGTVEEMAYLKAKQ